MRRLVAALFATIALCACENKDARTLFVGTYSDGFYAFDFDLKTGDILPADGEYGAVAKADMPNPEKGGVGLANVKQRLKLLYDSNYTLHIQDDADTYNVELTIPLNS